MNMTDRFVRFAAEGEVMAKFSRNLERCLAQPWLIYTPQEHETYVKKLTENLTSKDHWDPIFSSFALDYEFGRYKDKSQ